MENLLGTKETIVHYMVELMRTYTKMVTLSNPIKVKKNTLILDALDYLHRHEEEQQNVVKVAVEYKLWHAYLVEQLHVDFPYKSIVKLL